MHYLEQKIADYIASSGLFDRGQKVLLAVSGGADSVALLNVVYRLREGLLLDIEPTVMHINHNLRGKESDKDERFVEKLCAEMDLNCIVRSMNVRNYAAENKLSIESAARVLRIDNFIDIADKIGCKKIATAHHKNDNAETVVHRMIRGTGFRGLGGIWPKKKFGGDISFVRPMLCVSRGDIMEYCTYRNICWRQDHTNDDRVFTRNRIRHLLLPRLEIDYEGNLSEDLLQLSGACQKLYGRVGCEVERVWESTFLAADEGRLRLNRDVFNEQPELVQVEIARRSIVAVGCGERNISTVHYESILKFAKTPGRRIHELPGGFGVIFEQSKITFCVPDENIRKSDDKNQSKDLEISGITDFDGYKVESKVLGRHSNDIGKFKTEKDSFVEWFDYERLVFPLTIRRRRVGDSFEPLGKCSGKKVGKFLTAQKIESDLRDGVVVIEDKEKIIWLGPIRVSEQSKITSQTKKILQISISPIAEQA